MNKLLDDLMRQYEHPRNEESPRGPIVYEGDQAYSPQSLLLKTRTVRFGDGVMPNTANRLKDMLLMLDEMEDEQGEKYKDIFLYLDSPGGSIYALNGIVSTMEHILSPINVVCDGIAMSAGSIMLAMGTIGKRYALPHSTIMIHEAASMDAGRTSDRDVGYEQLHEQESRLADIYVDRCAFNEEGYCRWNHFTPETSKVVYSEEPVNNMTTKEEAAKWLIHGLNDEGGWWHYDRFMSPELAQRWGIVDHIVTSKKEIPAYRAIIEEREKRKT